MDEEIPSYIRDNPDAKYLNDPITEVKDKEHIWRATTEFKPVVAPAVARLSHYRDPPWMLKSTPREVQMEAMRRSIGGFALFDKTNDVERFRVLRPHGTWFPGFNYFMEMRLGKTYASLNDFAIQRAERDIRWLVVFTVNSGKGQWAEEVAASGLDTPVHVFESSRRKAAADFVAANLRTGGILVLNHEGLISQETFGLIAMIAREGKVMFVGDESLAFKNPFAVTTKNAVKLSQMGHRSVPLSGKPVSQGPNDLYGQLRFGRQAQGWSAAAFRVQFNNMGGFQGKQIIGPRNTDQLRAMIEPHSFIARGSDWLQTPGVSYVDPIHVELAPEQKRLIKEMEKDFMVEIAGQAITGEQIISRHLKMQQIRSGFIYDNDGVSHEIIPPSRNPVLQNLLRLLREDIHAKAIVVGYYQPTMDMLEKELAEFNPAVLRGAEWHRRNNRPIDEEKRRFNNDPRTRVIVGQETSLRYLHTLMGSYDDPTLFVIFFENSYSLNDRSQTEKRPQGGGQRGVVNMVDFFASKLDRRTVIALQRKEDISAVTLNYAREEGILPYVKV